jgi:hypothetical protein
MNKNDEKLFKLVNKKSNVRWKRFAKYYANDSKPFINKLSRDYESTGKFPYHVLKMIKKIPIKEYDSAVCVLRGALPYSVLFELMGWKVHYVVCGRRNEENQNRRFNRSVDKTLDQIKGKKVLLIENNSPSGNTPLMVALKLKKSLNIKKPDLFLDYFFPDKKKPKWMTKLKITPFWENKKKLSNFGKVYESTSLKIKPGEGKKLVQEFLDKEFK